MDQVPRPQGEPGLAAALPVGAVQIEAARELLDGLPYPVVTIDAEYGVRWRNLAARAEYGDREATCHLLTHGFEGPCDQHGEECPMRLALRSKQPASVAHVHDGHDGPRIFKVTAIPVVEGGVLEIHWPLDDVVVRDSLTGVLARRFFEQMVRRELELMKRVAQPFGLVLIDLDRLKRLNDLHGHAAGDAALRAVGRCLLATARSSDVVGRMGGDEFALFLPATRPASASALARRIQTAMHRVRLPGLAAERPTVSIGVSARTAGYDLVEALAAADRALYQAKQAGRDRISTAD